MELIPALKKLENSTAFKKWHKKNKNTYFSYAFKIPQEMPNQWQLGFYSKKKDKITTFVIEEDSIDIRPEEEVFKKEGTKVNEIQIADVKLTFGSAIAKADEFQKKTFPNDRSAKTIAILQNTSELGNIWNITYVTEAFNTLNMKINASTGEIIEHKLFPVLSFKKQ